MSSVFHAVHVETGHEVAVKVLPRTLAKNPTLLQRFLREAKNAEGLEHKNIAAIYDRGFDQGRHYLVLEYVEGGDLHERIRLSGPLEINDAVNAVRAVAEGLRYASKQGVIHRDVKPANLLRTPAGLIKIIDLGLALQTETEDERVTRDGTTVGTVDYMSPEQARDSRATSERSDIYSLGCTFYFILAGKPPFPGGDVPDKLGRHCTAPIPDVRVLRPEVPETLALLIQKMMAKKPEGRFASYDALIVAIDSLAPSGSIEPGETFDALIADDEDEVTGLEPIPFTLPGAASRPALPTPLASPPRRNERPAPRAERAPVEVSLAELAELDADVVRPTRSKPKVQPSASLPANLDPDLFEDSVPVTSSPRASSSDVPLRTWVAAGAVIGLAIALLGYGALQILNPASPISLEANNELPNEGEAQGSADQLPNEVAVSIKPQLKSTRSVDASVKSKSKSTPPPPVVWTEPVDPLVPIVPEPVYAPLIEAGSLPEWARSAIPATVDGPSVTLRRVPDPSNELIFSSLRQALDKNGGLIEIADNGPFFEDDCRIVGRSRILRAKPGFRPMLMIRVDSTSLALVRERQAVFSLDGIRLILEGLDLVVDVRELPPATSSLFLLKGAELTLNNCSVTILNGSDRPFPMVRVIDPADDRPNRISQIRVERSFLRVSSQSIFDLNGPADVALIRSVVLGGSVAVISQKPYLGRGDDRLYFVRTLIASRGSVIEIPTGRLSPTPIRALGCTFANVAGVLGTGLIRVPTELVATPKALLDWEGKDNAFVGWPCWLSAGERHVPIVAGLTKAAEIWGGIEPGSRESKRGWPASVLDDDASALSLQGLNEERPSILSRVASPSPSLLQATVRSFTPSPIPALPPRTRGQSRDTTRPKQPGTSATDLKSTELTFDLRDPEWRGDLGFFLARKLSAEVPNIRIKVNGTGSWFMSPVRLPEGVSVEIVTMAPSGQEPSWTAANGASGVALIDVVKSDLTLTGVQLVGSSSAKLSSLIKVGDGRLMLNHCLLTSTERGMLPTSSLILFRAAGTRPLPVVTGRFLTTGDRPVLQLSDCSLVAIGGEAVSIELGRGVASFSNSVLISEGDGAAIGLRPQKVARARFEADLRLDHCSIAAERSLFRLNPWTGSESGPDRPWLVTTKTCAYFEIAQRGRRESVLLRSRSDALAHGSLFWQADGDAYDLGNFSIEGDQTPPIARLRPDVKSQWVGLWGTNHITNVIGPNPRRTEAVLGLLARDRLRPGGLSAEALKLDPKAHPGLGADFSFIPIRSTRTGSQ